MRWGIGNWPPVASHAAFFLMGMSMTNLWHEERVPPGVIGRDRLILAVRAEASLPTKGSNALILAKADRRWCIVNSTPFAYVRAHDLALIKLPWASVNTLGTYEGKRSNLLAIAAENLKSGTNPCDDSVPITYGFD